jgi:hypothetical protein
MTKAQIKKELQKAQEAESAITGALPNMNPDVLDMFVTWLYDRVDLRSFHRSDNMYKIKKYKEFRKSLDPNDLQYHIQFKQ